MQLNKQLLFPVALSLTMSGAVLFTGMTSAWALERPSHSSYDRRIQYIDYNPDEVVQINSVAGFVTDLCFASDEVVQSYVTGFSTAWDFAASGNHLFLKPKEEEGSTNLVVVTDKRTYNFQVQLIKAAGIATYQLRFRYPQEEAAKRAAALKKKQMEELMAQKQKEEASAQEASMNYEYTMNFGSAKESRDIAPVKAWDDGRLTYLKFRANSDFPLVYRVTTEGESLLNSHVEGQVLVIHGIYPKFILRAGQAVVGIYNERYTGGAAVPPPATTIPGLQRRIVGGDEQ